MKNLVVLTIQGLGDRARQRLQSFLYEIADDLCDVTASEELADAAMIDTDSGFDLEGFRRRYPSMPIMVLAGFRPNFPNVIWIPKPIMEAALTEALSWVRIALNHSAPGGKAKGETAEVGGAGETLALPTGTPNQAKVAEKNFQFYNLEDTLLHTVLSAWKQAETSLKPVRCKVEDTGYLLILPKSQEVFSSVSSNKLLAWCESESINQQIEVTVLQDNDAEQILSSGINLAGRQPLVPFVWRIAIWTSRGRLPKGTDTLQRYYLRCWPNFTRLLELPHAMTLAALWVQEPMTMSFLVDALKISEADVANFHVATTAIGLAGPALREVDYLLANKQGEEQNSRVIHVMSSIGRHFAAPVKG